jgi:hypothetical protein
MSVAVEDAEGRGPLAPVTARVPARPARGNRRAGTRTVAERMSEAELAENVRLAVLSHHLLSYHTYDSRRSASGFPDWVIVGRKILFRELKTMSGHVSKAQARWLSMLREAGGDAKVWRPDDWPDTILAELRELR